MRSSVDDLGVPRLSVWVTTLMDGRGDAGEGVRERGEGERERGEGERERARERSLL